MLSVRNLILALVTVLSASPALADSVYKPPVVPTPAQVDPNDAPDLLAFGLGWEGVKLDHTERRRQAFDMRAEFRSGYSLLPWAKSYFQIHPIAVTSLDSSADFFAGAGVLLDVPLGKHFSISPNFVPGFYDRGVGQRLGSLLEFRSTFELAYRFDNEVRLAGYLSHTSNDKITHWNPGINTTGLYVQMPTSMIFGK